MKQINFDNGKITSNILNAALPMLVAQILSLLYNIVDRIYIARIPDVGTAALGAVGLCFPLIIIITAFSNLFGSGGAPIFSINRGMGETRRAQYVVNTSFTMVCACAMVLMVIGFLFARPLLVLFGASESALVYAYPYMMIYLIGTLPSMLTTGMNPFINAQGYATTGMISVMIGAVANLILDPLFIFVFELGIEGAAIATVISQAFSGIACVIYSKRRFEILHTDEEERKVNKGYMKTLCGMGVPMGLQYSITAIGSVILQSAVNTLGSNAVASMTAGSKIGMFFCCPYDALGSTMATYGGQNVGAKKLDRLSGGLKAAGILGIGYSILAFVVLWLCGNQLAMFFVESAQAEVIANVRLFLVCNSAFYIPLAFVNIVRFLIQGMGYSKFAILAGVFEMAARTLVGFVFVPMFGYPAACFASPVAWIFADAFLFPAYFHVLKKTKKMLYK